MSNNISVLFVDLETLATDPKAAVIQLGWVAANIDPRIEGAYEFESGEISFTQRSNNMAGRTVSRSTVDWWTRDDERRKTLENIREKADTDVQELPQIFRSIIAETNTYPGFNAQNFQLWARGVFDFPILKSFYYNERSGEFKDLPWSYRQECDFRTFTRLNKAVQKEAETEFAGFNPVREHNALYDARRDLNTLATFFYRGWIAH